MGMGKETLSGRPIQQQIRRIRINDPMHLTQNQGQNNHTYQYSCPPSRKFTCKRHSLGENPKLFKISFCLGSEREQKSSSISPSGNRISYLTSQARPLTSMPTRKTTVEGLKSLLRKLLLNCHSNLFLERRLVAGQVVILLYLDCHVATET